MARPEDLTQFGADPFMARRVGTTLVTGVTAAGTTQATATALANVQSLTMVTTGTGGVLLPTVNGDNAYVTDCFTIHNGSSGTIGVYTPTGVTLNVSAAQFTATKFSLAQFLTLVCQPVTSTQWIGVLSA